MKNTQKPLHSRRTARFLAATCILFVLCPENLFPQSGAIRPPGAARRPTPAVPSLVPPSRPNLPPVPAAAPSRPPAPAAANTATTATAAADEEAPKLSFKDAPMDQLWTMYSEITGRTLLLAPKLPRENITLRNQSDLDIEQTLEAIEAVLSMHGVALLREGERFLRVVPISKAREEPMNIKAVITEDATIPETSELISQMIALKHIDTVEAEKAIAPFRHAAFGKVVQFERTNHILVTDTAANVSRIAQIIEHIDQPTVAREEPHIIQIVYAKAADIKQKLEEIIAESQRQEEQKKKQTAPAISRSGPPRVEKRTVPGVIRPPLPETTTPSFEPEDIADIIEQAERGIIRGRVQIIADDRTNLLIVITRPENMRFFERIIKVLDVESGPDVIVKVFRLEFAEAGSIASMLNSLIGAAATSKDAAPAGTAPAAEGESATDKRSAALREYIERQQDIAAKHAGASKSKVGELAAANIKILSDERTNSLIIMASKADILTLEEIIKDMDMMLSQVLIESIIIEVQLGDELQTGIDWLNRSLIHYRQNPDGSTKPYFANTGSLGGGTLAPRLATTSASSSPGGLTQYFTFFGLNMDMVIQMVSKDDRTRVVSAPIILTTDNTEATISSTEQIYVFQGKKRDQYGGEYDDYKTEDVGLHLTVKPHINENKLVMMEIKQTMSEPGSVGEPQSGASVSSERSLQASIAVRNRQTIVLGGQVRNQTTQNRTKVPLLGDIPLLGRLFSYNSSSANKREMVVFITPYVLDTAEQIERESTRRKLALSTQGLWRDDWSGSTFAEPTPKGKKARAAALEAGRARAESESATLATPVVPVVPATTVPPEPIPAPTLDPALLDFIRRQEQRWQEAMKEADRRIGEETGGPQPAQNNVE